jgi:hypothetical protein
MRRQIDVIHEFNFLLFLRDKYNTSKRIDVRTLKNSELVKKNYAAIISNLLITNFY